MTRKKRRKLTRREFIQSSAAAAGLAMTLPGLLAGCGDGDDSHSPSPTPTPVRGPRERRTMQFDLSHNGRLAAACLVAFNSESYLAKLKPHDDASRRRFRERTPELEAIPDEHLTHYLEDVDLPADALQFLTVIGTTSDGAPALLGAVISIPSATLAEYAERAVRGEAALPRALMARYGIGEDAGALARVLEVSNSCVNPLTTAVAFCFHHPDLMNLNLTLGANTLIAYIQDLPASCTNPDLGCKYIDGLAFEIATHSPATTTPGGWATLVPQTYADGKPLLDQNGDPVYRYDLSDGTTQQMAEPLRQVLAAVFDDAKYEGSNWNATTGLANIEQSGAAAPPGGSPFEVQASLPVGSTHNGIEFVSLAVTDAASRGIDLEIRNRYLRWLRAYAQYFAPDGTPLPVQSPTDDDTTRAKYLREITSNNQIMGIPLMGNDVSKTNLRFEIPEAASKARIIIGGLGMGGEAFCPEALVGSALTLAFNIGLPTLLLSWGIGETASAGVGLLANNQELRDAIVGSVRMWLISNGASYGVGIYGSETSKDVACFIAALGNSLIQVLMESIPLIAQYIAIQGSEQAVTAVPILGAVFKVLEIYATLAAIAVCIGEVLASQALTENDITLSFDVNLTIKPEDFRFPPEADSYDVVVSLDKSVSFTASGSIDPGTTSPIPVALQNIPSGGQLSVEVVLKSSNGWIAATAAAGPLPATPDGAGLITLTVKNRLVPLTAQTQYQHTFKLEYQGGERVWMQTPDGPTATRAALDCATDDSLCALTQINISPRSGMLGYGWRSGGLNVPLCGAGVGGVLFTFQNVFAAPPPDSALKFAGCGFTQPAALVYDARPASPGGGGNFYVEPAADGDGFWVRSVVLDETTPFDLAQTSNWGRFTLPLDSYVVHPGGWVVGVSAANHKVEVLSLPAAPVPDSMPPMSPWATMRSGLGTRAGLTDTPVAVAVHKGVVLVLEQGNNRIQALDVAGNPVEHFAGGTSPFAALPQASGVVRVDLATDALGYLFVLSYSGNGAQPSDYRLEIYDPEGTLVTSTTGIAAGRIAVDPFRTLYALNYEAMAGAPRIEPTVSQWLPSTPG